MSAEQRVDGHVWRALSTPASDPCSGGGLVARPGLFKLAGLKSRRCQVVGGFLGGMVTFPASRCFTLCSTAVFTGPGEGYKAEHRETRGHHQKSVPAEFVKTTTMQSTASHWEVNLLAVFAGSLSSTCPYPGFLHAALSFGEERPLRGLMPYILAFAGSCFLLSWCSWF